MLRTRAESLLARSSPTPCRATGVSDAFVTISDLEKAVPCREVLGRFKDLQSEHQLILDVG